MLDTEAWNVATERDRCSSDPFGLQPAFASPQAIADADELRLQLRARLLGALASPARPWSVGAD
jgi:hypothetical protein